MRQFVGEDAIELRQVLHRAGHRHANLPVKLSVGPLRSAGDVVKLLLPVENDVDRRRRIGAQCLADLEECVSEHTGRTGRERLLYRTIEPDRETIVFHGGVVLRQCRFISPLLEAAANSRRRPRRHASQRAFA